MCKSFINILLSFFIFSGCCVVNIPLGFGDKELVESTVQGEGENKILLIDISGTITDEEEKRLGGLRQIPSLSSRIKEKLKKADKDPLIKAVILRINSPGGTVTASDIIYHEIKEFRKKKNIPVIASMMDLATSGGYYVALAADKIIAHPTTVTGSIGVLAFRFNAKELMDKIGIQNETITSGDKKTLLYPFEPLTAEDRAILQKLTDDLHRTFKNVVVEARSGLNAEQVEKLADGRVYDAKQALEHKLIDYIGYLDDAVEMAKKEAGIDRAQVIMYHRPSGYKNNIYSQANFSPAASTFNLINFDMGSIMEKMGVQFMYIWLP